MVIGNGFGRRQLLADCLGLLALSGCATIAARDIGAPSPRAPATFAALVRDVPFYVAHRGGGSNWPEMTAYAYDRAAALPYVNAIEVSVCLSSDGVLVCSHDLNTLRVTGVDLEIAATDWATLSQLQVTAAFTDDPGQPARPLARFDEVVEKHLPNLVVFAEPKTSQAVGPLMTRLARLAQPERTVWKQPVNQPNFATAKANGFGTWGYALDEPGHLGERLPRFAADPNIDILGIEKSEPDPVVSRVVSLATQDRKSVV